MSLESSSCFLLSRSSAIRRGLLPEYVLRKDPCFDQLCRKLPILSHPSLPRRASAADSKATSSPCSAAPTTTINTPTPAAGRSSRSTSPPPTPTTTNPQDDKLATIATIWEGTGKSLRVFLDCLECDLKAHFEEVEKEKYKGCPGKVLFVVKVRRMVEDFVEQVEVGLCLECARAKTSKGLKCSRRGVCETERKRKRADEEESVGHVEHNSTSRRF